MLLLLPLYLQGSQEDGLLVDLIGEEEKRQRWINLKVTLNYWYNYCYWKIILGSKTYCIKGGINNVHTVIILLYFRPDGEMQKVFKQIKIKLLLFESACDV